MSRNHILSNWKKKIQGHLWFFKRSTSKILQKNCYKHIALNISIKKTVRTS